MMIPLKRFILSSTLLIAFSTLGGAQTAPTELKVQEGQKVAFMGDSITAQGWDTPGGYVKLVVAGLQTLGIKIVPIPAGVGGNTSKDMLARLDKDVLSKKPDWLTLSCGVNDVWHGTGGVELEAFKQNITSIVDQAQAANIKVMILTATVIQENENDNNRKLVAYNDFLRDLAAKRNLPLADLNAAFQAALKANPPPASGTKLLTVDGVHANPDGNQVMANGVLKAFGISEAQLAKVDAALLDAPASAVVNAVLTFRVGTPVTIRQYNALKKAAAAQKTSVPDQNYALYFDALRSAIKAHEQDPSVKQSQIEAESQQGFKEKIEALAKP